MITTPDYEAAAIKAMELLKEKGISATPIMPLPFLKNYPRVMVQTFASAADNAGMDRNELLSLFDKNQDAATFHVETEDYDYVVIYNQFLPFEVIWRGIARELGHIVLGHDGSTRTSEARMSEASCFARHLLCPRPIIHMIQESGIPLTTNVLASVTGCSDECVDGMRIVPGVRVPKELNRAIKAQFSRCIQNFIDFSHSRQISDSSSLVDFGTYMDNYED